MRKKRRFKTAMLFLNFLILPALICTRVSGSHVSGYAHTEAPERALPAKAITLLSDSGTVPPNHLVNILLVGQDRRADESRQRADAMILCSLDTKNDTITLTSFLRDLYVEIPGYQANKMNAAYALGGIPLVKETILDNFGISVDACVEVDFSGFEEVIDLLGGVEMEITPAEAEHLNQVYGWSLTTGTNHLDGEKALAYARIRKIDSDFSRTHRQRKILTSVLQNCRGLGLIKLTKLISQVLPLLTTDLSHTEILAYSAQLFPLLSSGQVKNLRIPAEGMYEDARINNQMVLIPDLAANRALLWETLMGE